MAVCPQQTRCRIVCRCNAGTGLKGPRQQVHYVVGGVLVTVMKPTKIVTVIQDLNFRTRSRSCPVALYLVSASQLPFVLVTAEVPI